MLKGMRAWLQPRRVLILCVGLVWAVQPFTLGELLGDALARRSGSLQTVGSVMAWLWWFLTLLALAAARPAALTAARIGAVAAIPAGLWAATSSDDAVLVAVGLAAGFAAAGLVLLPGVGDRFADGLSYGDERRFLLRPSGPVMLAMLPLTWAVTVAALWAPPLLLADRRWVLGAGAAVVGSAVGVVGFRAMHQLSRRFVVFVPNGLVLHDPATLREPVLFTRPTIASLRPADADSTAADLSVAALGLALELKLTEPVGLAVLTGRGSAEQRQVDSLLFVPTRPAAVMATALDRNIAIA